MLGMQFWLPTCTPNGQISEQSFIFCFKSYNFVFFAGMPAGGSHVCSVGRSTETKQIIACWPAAICWSLSSLDGWRSSGEICSWVSAFENICNVYDEFSFTVKPGLNLTLVVYFSPILKTWQETSKIKLFCLKRTLCK